ncbi:integrin alpha-9-like [Battus philenor]|uniref:integrin alpha-9-like n=1 Tax=Battus philenor TaxID=42288 RepID=UPI0035CF5503
MTREVIFNILSLSLISLCVCNVIFHEGSVITYLPDDYSMYFGYSVLLSDMGLIVGAPKAASRDNKKISPGLIFNCELQNLDVRNSTCQPIGLSINVHGKFFGRVLLARDFFRDDMWFGATIASVPDGKLIACAPRWAVPYKDKHLLANGACYIISQKRGMTLLPLKEMNHQAYKTDGARREYGEYGTHLNFYAYGQAGISVKVTEDNSIIIGAPGLLQWTGGIVDYQYNPEPNSMFISKQPTTNPYFTKELVPDDYFGYSVESGVFGIDNKTLYIAGAPRSKLGYGQVLIFEPAFRENDPLKVIKSLRGPQLGCYFGASLCTMDVNADGKLDLLVGAPNFVTKEGEPFYDQGAVFVYLNKHQDINFTLEYKSFVSGSNMNGARFGSAIADMGDIDGDGYRDVAIGAPWESEGQGAVYIYKGSEKGLSGHYIQKIVAPNAQSFGISISRGFDVDQNNCSDLAIGAINSNTVHLYRCVPTMEVTAAIQVPDAMYLPLNATNFTALFCVESREQSNWPHVKTTLLGKITVDSGGGRAWISGDSEYEIDLSPGNRACEEQIVQVLPTADLSKPITIKFNIEPKIILKDDSPIFLRNEARLSEKSKLYSSFDIQLNRDCGEDLICKPLLEMNLKALNSPYVPGSGNRLGVEITVLNKDEPAYGAKVHLPLPSLPKRLPSACALKALNVTCNLPAPLHRNEKVTWEIELEFTQNNSVVNEINMEANLEDPLHAKNASDKITRALTIVVKPEATFNITGTVQPNRTISVTRNEFDNGDSVAFVHYFQITNLGPSDWYNLSAKIIAPYKMNLSNSINGCLGDDDLFCSWSLNANASLAISLSYKFNLSLHGDYFEKVTKLNATSTIILLGKENRNCSITTTLVLDPTQLPWSWIIGIVAGLLVFAVIVFCLYKFGFFTRQEREDLKRLQEASEDSNSLSRLDEDNDACTQEIQLSDASE